MHNLLGQKKFSEIEFFTDFLLYLAETWTTNLCTLQFPRVPVT